MSPSTEYGGNRILPFRATGGRHRVPNPVAAGRIALPANYRKLPSQAEKPRFPRHPPDLASPTNHVSVGKGSGGPRDALRESRVFVDDREIDPFLGEAFGEAKVRALQVG
uniref:Uncharacterized protein n=1 Tax=Candidatus Kentrum sp. TC TaxID=2126339 RepID=A0A450ZP97_9GAMM|nr:MAG: hypothetical protein BECKTC1821F_GA0114240_100716 [Candidatus Kentron sp. TC]